MCFFVVVSEEHALIYYIHAAGEDYVPVDVDITFTEADSMTEKCYDIAIIDDGIVEVSESFIVELIGSNVFGNKEAIITINPNLDNIDSKLVY